MKRALGWIGLATLIAVAGVAAYALIEIGPRNLWGLWKYDTRHEGSLVVGNQAPDLVLTELDGATSTSLLALSATRPLVIVFGSFT